MGGPASGLPARGGGTRPPFEPGNLAALRPGHGGYSMQLREQRYEAALPAIREHFPAAPGWWHEDYALARVTLQALAQALLSGGVMQGDRTRGELLKDYRAQQRVVLELLREAGMTPASAARLFRDQATGAAAAIDVGAVVAAGRQAAGS